MDRCKIIIFFITAFFDFSMLSVAQEVCNNGFDDDLDGYVDHFDSDCCTDINYYTRALCENDCERELNTDMPLTFSTYKNLSNKKRWYNTNHPLGYVNKNGFTELIGRAGIPENESHTELLRISKEATIRMTNIAPISRWGVPYGIVKIDHYDEPIIVLAHNDQGEANVRRRLSAYKDTTLLWVSDEQYITKENYDAAVVNFADFDNNGSVEVFVGTAIYDTRNGQKLADIIDENLSRGVQFRKNYSLSMITYAADVLPDSRCTQCDGLELIAGNTIYSVDLINGQLLPEIVIPQTNDGFSSLADVNDDDQLDIIHISRVENETKLVTYDITHQDILHTYAFSAFEMVTSIPIFFESNLNGDKFLLINTVNAFHVLILDNNPNVITSKWMLPTVDNSGQTGVSLFQYVTDKEPVVLHKDQEKVRVLDIRNNDILWSAPCISNTNIESPVMINFNGKPKLICSCDDALLAFKPNIKTLEVPSFWNQYINNNVSINEDLEPFHSFQNKAILETRLNSLQYPYSPLNIISPDYWIDNVQLLCPGKDKYSLEFFVRKDKNASWDDSIRVALYDTPTKRLIVEKYIYPSVTDTVVRDTVFIDNMYETAIISVNLSQYGANSFIQEECDKESNIMDLKSHYGTTDLIPDSLSICGERMHDFGISSEFLLEWNDGSILSERSFSSSGYYYVKYLNCLFRGVDSVYVTITPLVDMQLPQQVEICKYVIEDSTFFERDTIEVARDVEIVYSDFEYLYENGQLVITDTDDKSGKIIFENSHGCRDTSKINFVVKEVGEKVFQHKVCFQDTIHIGEDVIYRKNEKMIYTRWLQPQEEGACRTYERHEIEFIIKPEVKIDVQPPCNGGLGRVSIIGANAIWSDGSQDSVRNLKAGLYNIELQHLGCQWSDSIKIPARSNIEQALRVIPISCPGRKDGQIFSSSKDVSIEISTSQSIIGKRLNNGMPDINYYVTLSRGECSLDTVIQFQEPEITGELYKDVYRGYIGDSILIYQVGNDVDIDSFWWDKMDFLTCIDCSEPTFIGLESEEVVVKMITVDGCFITQTIQIELRKKQGLLDESQLIYIPNVCTPNFDGINDVLHVYPGREFAKIEKILFYDKWGGLVYSSQVSECHPEIPCVLLPSYINWSQFETLVYEVIVRDIYNKKHHLTGLINILH